MFGSDYPSRSLLKQAVSFLFFNLPGEHCGDSFGGLHAF
jgi:hypothetical protein